MNLEPFKSADDVYCMLALDHRDALRNAFRRAGVEEGAHSSCSM